MSEFLQPLERISVGARRRIEVVLCDIDDTLTTEGRLAYVTEAAGALGFAELADALLEAR